MCVSVCLFSSDDFLLFRFFFTFFLLFAFFFCFWQLGLCLCLDSVSYDIKRYFYLTVIYAYAWCARMLVKLSTRHPFVCNLFQVNTYVCKKMCADFKWNLGWALGLMAWALKWGAVCYIHDSRLTHSRLPLSCNYRVSDGKLFSNFILIRST